MMRTLVHVLMAVAGVLLPSQAQPPQAPSIPDWVSVESNIHYDQYPETVLDILQSKRATGQKRPGVIVIHGGGWVEGDKEHMVATFCIPYLEQGFVVANVDYRLAKTALAPAAVTDVLKAAGWFRNNAKRYGVDTRRIVVTGDSAGGHLALMVGMAPKSAKLGPAAKVAAVVNWYGITDVVDQIEGPNMREYAVAWLPENTPDRERLARRVSPMTYVRKGLPPVLTIHGDTDPTVPYQQGIELTKALRDHGVDAEMISVPGGQHGNFGAGETAELNTKVLDFLKRHGVI